MQAQTRGGETRWGRTADEAKALGAQHPQERVDHPDGEEDVARDFQVLDALLGIGVAGHLGVEAQALAHNHDDAVVDAGEDGRAHAEPGVRGGRRGVVARHADAEGDKDQAAHREAVGRVEVPHHVDHNEGAAPARAWRRERGREGGCRGKVSVLQHSTARWWWCVATSREVRTGPARVHTLGQAAV